MNKKLYLFIVGLLIILGVFLFARYLRTPKSNSAPVSVATTSINLPTGWSEINTDSPTLKKYEKKVDSGLKPQIVLITSEVAATADFEPEKYIDKLIAGAKSTLPTLRLSNNSSGTFGPYVTRELTGYYKNGKTKVDFRQKIYLHDQKVYTLTASYDRKTGLDKEIDLIFNEVVSRFLTN